MRTPPVVREYTDNEEALAAHSGPKWTCSAVPRGSGRARMRRPRWTCCSWTKRGRCRWRMSLPSLRRPIASSCWGIRSSSINRRRRRIRTAWASRRWSTCWAAPRRCPRSVGFFCRLPIGCRRRSPRSPRSCSTTASFRRSRGWRTRCWPARGPTTGPGCGWCRWSTTAIRTRRSRKWTPSRGCSRRCWRRAAPRPAERACLRGRTRTGSSAR